MGNKLYVGNLPFSATEQVLRVDTTRNEFMVPMTTYLKKLSLPALFRATLAACSSDGPSAPEEAPAESDAMLRRAT